MVCVRNQANWIAKPPKRTSALITQNIYAEFDKALGRDLLVELLKPHLDERKFGDDIADFIKGLGEVEACIHV